jgi:hypothetical protein
MTQERQQEIKIEAERRLKEWLTHSTFDKMTVYGSRLRFNMALGLFGYPSVKEKWMKGKGFDVFVTEEEFNSEEYDKITDELFYENLTKYI